MKTVIVLLGASNDQEGNLSDIAKERALKARDLFLKEKDVVILITGGFGSHFNTTTHSHASYLKQYLLQQGIPETYFLGFALSGHTVEDAVMAKKIIDTHLIRSIVVVTSDFHTMRVRIVFTKVFDKSYTISFFGAKSSMNFSKKIFWYTREVVRIPRLLFKKIQ